jgi:O-antigen/teichoic acid export membrane protein
MGKLGTSRTANSSRNTIFGILTQLVYLLATFATRTILIRRLGADYLGLTSVFQNILSMLSIAELGFGTVIMVSMYKPIADGDEAKIKAYLNAFRKIYAVIGLIILVAGLCVLPFINTIAGNNPDETGIPSSWVYWFFLVYLFSTVASYFFSYKRALIQADQKRYIDNINNLVFTLLKNGLMIACLLVLAEKQGREVAYLAYLIVQPILVILENVSISLLADKRYPFIKNNKEQLDPESKKDLRKSALSIFVHRAAETLVTGSDSVMISMTLGVTIVGYYANYMLIYSVGSVLVLLPMAQMGASIGNLIVTSDKTQAYHIFKRIFFGYFILLGLVTGGMFILTESFMSNVWLSKEIAADPNYLLPWYIFFTIIACFYVRFSREPIAAYKEATKLFQVDWPFSIAKVLINVVVSLGLGIPLRNAYGWEMGLLGIVLGTIACLLLTSIWDEPYYVYKRYFGVSLWPYIWHYLLYTLVNAAAIAIAYYSVHYIPDDFGNLGANIGILIAKVVIVLLVMSAFYVLCYFKTPYFQYFVGLAKKTLAAHKHPATEAPKEGNHD